MNNEKSTDIRELLWCNVWEAVARSSNCTKMATPTQWADEALKQYDERFRKHEAKTI